LTATIGVMAITLLVFLLSVRHGCISD
jgi:hypothetical protein